MYEYIQGELQEINPAGCIIECGGIGYSLHISLHTYSQIGASRQVKLFLHQVVREDAHLLFAFFTREERELFRHLLSVSGIGANTARMMLSAQSPVDLQQAIVTGNASLLQSIKGIGAKTAQRVIVDLADRFRKDKSIPELFAAADNRIREEALSALVMLGFSKSEADKAVSKVITTEKELNLETLIKKALKLL